MGYDEHYTRTKALFGTEPEPILVRHADLLPKGQAVLDIGAGQGRNAVFMAAKGLTVHALEPSRVGGQAIAAAADRQQLDISVFPDPFATFAPPVAGYGGIMVFGLIPDLDWSGITGLQQRITAWSVPGTVLWITGFTTEDPAYRHQKIAWRETGPNAFVSPEGRVRTYLEPGQICDLFADWEILHHGEGMGPEHRHGDGPVERHCKFEAVFQRS